MRNSIKYWEIIGFICLLYIVSQNFWEYLSLISPWLFAAYKMKLAVFPTQARVL